jgi:O-antigen ligase
MALLVMVGFAGVRDLRVTAAIAALVGLVGLAVVSYQRPRAALSACFFLILAAGTKFRHREASASLEGSLDAQILFELVLFAASGVAVLAAWLAEGDRRRPTLVEVLIGAYCTIALLSTLWSAAPGLTLVRAAQLVVVAAVAIAGVRLLRGDVALWTACASVAAYAIFCSIVGPTFPWASEFADAEDRFRFAWFQVHPIAVGTLAGIAALGLLSTAFWRLPHRSPRMLGLPLAWFAAPVVGILVFTNSRGPLLAFLVGVAMLVFLRLRSSARLPIVLSAAAAALLVVAVGPDVQAWLFSAAAQDSTISRLLFQGQSADGVLGLNGRLELWTELRPVMEQQLFLGYGYQASRVTLLEIASWASYAHNAFMQSLLDLGIVGTVALVAVLVAGFSVVMQPRLPLWLRGTSTALMVFLVLNSVGTESFAGAPGFETLLVFVCALCASAGGRDRSGAAVTR